MRYVFAFVILLISSAANAATFEVNLNDAGYDPEPGPCYCGSGLLSSVYSFQPGDVIDFGTISFTPVRGGGPPSYPNAPVVYVYGNVGVSFNSSVAPQMQVSVGYYDFGPSTPYELIYVIPDGDNSIQISFGPGFTYEAPAVPEPSTWAMMIIGFCSVGFLTYRRNGLGAGCSLG
jgi:hypothetical protein